MAKRYYIKRNRDIDKGKDVNEEETNQNGGTEGGSTETAAEQTASPEVIANLQQIAKIDAQMTDAKTQYTSKTQPLEKMRNQLEAKLADLGKQTPKSPVQGESVCYNAVGVLFEAEVSGRRQRVLSNNIESTFKNLSTISYTLDTNGCNKLARKMIEFINSSNWDDDGDHWQDICNMMENYFANGVANYTDKEFGRFCDELRNVISVDGDSGITRELFGIPEGEINVKR